MKKLLFLSILLTCLSGASAQTIALKHNFLYDATLTPNLSLEVGLGGRTTLDVGGGYNWFKFSNNKTFKHWLVQPEFRYWTCERFNGGFWGLHAMTGQFNVGGVKFPFGMYPEMKTRRAEGWLGGVGISYGYQWIVGKRWNIEASIGAGYAHLWGDDYESVECGAWLGSSKRDYWGITRATVSLVYFLK